VKTVVGTIRKRARTEGNRRKSGRRGFTEGRSTTASAKYSFYRRLVEGDDRPQSLKTRDHKIEDTDIKASALKRIWKDTESAGNPFSTRVEGGL